MSGVTDYSPREELANRLSHGLGLLLGGIGLVLLLIKGWGQGTQALVSYSLYGGSLVLLYLASTLYHSMAEGRARRWCKVFDHCAIYLLIAGTYTPFLLVALDTPLANGLMMVIWGLALAGVVFKLVFINRFKKLSLFTYLMLGWAGCRWWSSISSTSIWPGRGCCCSYSAVLSTVSGSFSMWPSRSPTTTRSGTFLCGAAVFVTLWPFKAMSRE